MIEATATQTTRNAMDAAHEARGAAVRDMISLVRSFFKSAPATATTAPAALAH